MNDAFPDPLIVRLLSVTGRESAMSAIAAFSSHIAGFDPLCLSAGQATVLNGELRILERRMSTVREVLDTEAGETSALGAWWEGYAGQDDAAPRLVEAAGPVVAREIERQAEAERWFARLAEARDRFATRLGTSGDGAASPGPSPAVIRSLSRVNAGLDALLQDAATRRSGAADAMTRLRMWSLDALGVDPLARIPGGAAASGQ